MMARTGVAAGMRGLWRCVERLPARARVAMCRDLAFCAARCVFWCVAGFAAVSLMATQGARASDAPPPLRIYVDADFTLTPAPADAITLGLRVAFAKSGNMAAGQVLEVVEADHRGSPKRSHRSMQSVLRDPNALVVIGGMHSPPYLTYGDFINAQGIPLVLPWSAAGPITRLADGPQNHIFRLSVDDTKAGPFLVRSALGGECRRIAVLLADTGWGRANRATIVSAMVQAGVEPSSVLVVPNGVGEATGRQLVRQLNASRPDCLLAALTSPTHGPVLKALVDIAPDIMVFSHWGIMGQRLREPAMQDILARLDIRVLQTCELQMEAQGKPRISAALSEARDLGADASSLSDIPAVAGFVHAYDIGRILIAAVEQAAATPAWQDGSAARRTALRDALENLGAPVEGMLATYAPPFSPVGPETPDGHEALGLEQLCLARFDEGRLVAAPQAPLQGG